MILANARPAMKRYHQWFCWARISQVFADQPGHHSKCNVLAKNLLVEIGKVRYIVDPGITARPMTAFVLQVVIDTTDHCRRGRNSHAKDSEVTHTKVDQKCKDKEDFEENHSDYSPILEDVTPLSKKICFGYIDAIDGSRHSPHVVFVFSRRFGSPFEMFNSVKGLTALVTGGGSGLGFAVSKHLSRLGARVVALDLKPNEEEKLDNVIPVKGLRSECFQSVIRSFALGDIRKDGDIERALEQCKDVESGESRLNVLVNCAGVANAFKLYNFVSGKPHRLKDFQDVVDINILGTFNVVRLSIPLLANNPLNPNGLYRLPPCSKW